MKFKQKPQILFLKLKILPLIHFKELSPNHNQRAARWLMAFTSPFSCLSTQNTVFWIIRLNSDKTSDFIQNLRFYSKTRIPITTTYQNVQDDNARIIHVCQLLWLVYAAYVAPHASLGLNFELYKNLRLYSSKPQIKFGIWTFQKSRVGKIIFALAFPLSHPAQKMFRTWLGCLEPPITGVKQVP